MPDASDKVRHHLTVSRDVMNAALADNALISSIVAIAQCMEKSLRARRQDPAGRQRRQRRRRPAHCGRTVVAPDVRPRAACRRLR